MSFTWPKGVAPTEERWLKCLHHLYATCSIENKILQKKVNLTNAQRAAGQRGGRKRNERHYQTIKEMAAQGYSNDQIARRLDITRQRLYEFRSKHKI
jgi:DNA-binding NarL/FixJ family response regulator